IQSRLKPNGLWLNADFQLTEKWWQRLLLKLMLRFFKVICNIEASRLPDVEKQFQQYGFIKLSGQAFLKGFVIAKVYRNVSTI
ncbi:MAG: class I SAM-dependent methyltransferase, partial [Bacteroidota bacterium]|nr:class I SAM-dependent methyltransferase [Bacteroidota bacterium]